jgi:hypothetical protein
VIALIIVMAFLWMCVPALVAAARSCKLVD